MTEIPTLEQVWQEHWVDKWEADFYMGIGAEAAIDGAYFIAFIIGDNSAGI